MTPLDLDIEKRWTVLRGILGFFRTVNTTGSCRIWCCCVRLTLKVVRSAHATLFGKTVDYRIPSAILGGKKKSLSNDHPDFWKSRILGFLT